MSNTLFLRSGLIVSFSKTVIDLGISSYKYRIICSYYILIYCTSLTSGGVGVLAGAVIGEGFLVAGFVSTFFNFVST